jgi:hypothetical protein
VQHSRLRPAPQKVPSHCLGHSCPASASSAPWAFSEKRQRLICANMEYQLDRGCSLCVPTESSRQGFYAAVFRGSSPGWIRAWLLLHRKGSFLCINPPRTLQQDTSTSPLVSSKRLEIVASLQAAGSQLSSDSLVPPSKQYELSSSLDTSSQPPCSQRAVFFIMFSPGRKPDSLSFVESNWVCVCVLSGPGGLRCECACRFP